MTTAVKNILTDIKGQAAKIKQQHAEKQAELTQVNAEIRRLQDMPVSKADFSALLMQNIRNEAAEYTKNMSKAMFNPHSSRDTAVNAIGMKSLDFCIGGKYPRWIFNNTSADVLNNTEDTRNMRRALCWLMPETVHARIMEVIDQSGHEWGNEDLPSVAERREKIADLTERAADLRAELDELEAAIKDLSGVIDSEQQQLSPTSQSVNANYC
ncbi:hypothetical protein [Neisseria animalis]|uniref:Uncharacterized protein n=1 Tax=Neisseria animalis TaxID=492 RepID=A0A5P3MQL4_NEIAN|nr:hypothetical protein [Neisseria animalis]QEY23818.1 hypothetical protein D0T90_04285 [Neisseria animalis]ROW31597.1 hypothetical protein CGZ60_09485 [Neisseria animalis]VEE09788.1 Uncharacterised protein [Neisseria animalis]